MQSSISTLFSRNNTRQVDLPGTDDWAFSSVKKLKESGITGTSMFQTDFNFSLVVIGIIGIQTLIHFFNIDSLS